MAKITGLTAVSNYTDNSVYISGITTATITVNVEPTGSGTVTGVTLIFNDWQNPLTVSATKVSNKTWTVTRVNTRACEVSITVIANEQNASTATRSFSSVYTVLEHNPPTIDYTVFRCDSNGDRDMDGGYLSVTAWASSIPSVLSITSLGVKCVSDETNPVTIIDDGEGWFYEITPGQRYIFGNGSVDADTAYSMTFRAEDGSGTDNQAAEYIPIVQRIINVKDGGTGIAFGKRATEDNVIGKPNDWRWEGINEDFDSTGYVSTTGTSGAITVKTWNITEAGVYAISGTGYQTRNNYTAAQQPTMSGVLTLMRLNSSNVSQESYSQRAPLTGGGDCTVSAIMNCSAGDKIEFRWQQTAGSSGATLSSQTFYVRSALIRLV